MSKGIKVDEPMLVNLKKREAIVPLTNEQVTILKETKNNVEWRFELIPLTKKISFIGKKPKKRRK